MDRSSFLCCQPFLFPVPSSSVPDGHGLDPALSHDLLLDDVSLSIEPCENSAPSTNANVTSKRGTSVPAYFLPLKTTSLTSTSTEEDSANDKQNKVNAHASHQSKIVGECTNKSSGTHSDHAAISTNDPTMCKVALILHTAKLPEKGMTTPVKKANQRNLSEIRDEIEADGEAVLIANIDGNNFQVDLNQMLGMIVGPREDEDKLQDSERSDTTDKMGDTNTTGTKSGGRKIIPPYLLLEFPSCCFRIFWETQVASHSSDEETVIGTSFDRVQEAADRRKIKLNGVREKLANVFSIDFLLPFPLSYSGLIGVIGSLERSENKEMPRDPIGSARRCLWSYSQSWKDLVSFDDALENPLAAVNKENAFKYMMHQFMTRIPNQVALSFIEEDNRTMALESYDRRLCTKMQSFENLIDDFWTESSEVGRSNKRRRGKDEQNDADEPKKKVENGCAERYVKLLEGHKRYMISKHELYLLPLRG